jgi:uncharacterized membrane protein
MTTVEQSVEIEVPVSAAYNQWTQFEDFPEFMEGVERVEQVTDDKLHWVTKIAGVEREFDARITEQHPDERIAWTTMEGPKQAGVVTFHKLDPQHTKVMLQLEFEPEGIVEQAGDKLGLVKARVQGDLERFKTFMEQRGAETGSWRGDIN